MSALHVLAIDDNPKNLKVLSALLARQGISTTEVNDVKALGEVILTLGRVDAVFIDLEMPNGSGYEVRNWLAGQMENVPMIAYTVHLSEMHVAQQQGFDGFIGKPLDNVRFPEQVARILRGEPVWDRM